MIGGEKVTKLKILKNTSLVYIVKHIGIEGVYKIGVAGDLKKRLAQLSNASPYGIEVIHVEYAGNLVGMMESAIHDKWREKRVNNEWFELDEYELDQVVSELRRINDVFSICKGIQPKARKKLEGMGYSLYRHTAHYMPTPSIEIEWIDPPN